MDLECTIKIIHKLLFQAGLESLKGMSERSELIPCILYNNMTFSKILISILIIISCASCQLGLDTYHGDRMLTNTMSSVLKQKSLSTLHLMIHQAISLPSNFECIINLYTISGIILLLIQDWPAI